MVYIAVYMAMHCFICSDSDGLIKLWTIKTSECVKTLDDHSDKVKIAPVLNCSSYKVQWHRRLTGTCRRKSVLSDSCILQESNQSRETLIIVLPSIVLPSHYRSRDVLGVVTCFKSF